MKRLMPLAVLTALISMPAIAVDGVTDTEIKLGMVNAQSGPASGLGKGMRQGAEAWFKEVNAKGGVNGRQINLLVGDDAYEPDKTIDATLKMIDENKVFSLFGYVGTPTSNAALPIIKEMKVPLVGAFTGAMSLRLPVTPQMFNFRASYDDEAELLVDQFTKVLGAKKIGVFYQDDGFGLAVLSGTEKALKKRGMEVAVKGTFQRNTLSVKAGLATIMGAAPDAVIMVGPYAPVAAFIKEARTAGLKAGLGTVSFVGTTNLEKEVGDAGNGVVVSQVVPFPGDASLRVTKECGDAIAKHAPGEGLGFVNLEGCITAKLMVAGLEKAGKALTREGLVAALEGLSDVDMGGIKFSMNASNHQASNQVFLTQIKGGKAQPVAAISK